MKIKAMLITTAAAGILAFGISSANAQRGGGLGDGPRGDRAGQFMRGGEVLDVIVEQTSLEPREIVQRLRDGETLAEVITAEGGDVEAVRAAALEQAQSRIDNGLENGVITQEQADLLNAELALVVDDMLNGELMDRFEGRERGPRGDRGFGGFGGGEVVDTLEAETGLTGREIAERVRDGETLAEVITAEAGDVEVVRSAALEQGQARIDQAVENGRIDETRAAELTEQLEAMVDDALNGELRGRFGDGPRGNGPFGGNDNDAADATTEDDASA